MWVQPDHDSVGLVVPDSLATVSAIAHSAVPDNGAVSSKVGAEEDDAEDSQDLL